MSMMADHAEEAPRYRLHHREAGDELHREDRGPDERRQIEQQWREDQPAADPEEAGEERGDDRGEADDRRGIHGGGA